MDYVLAQLHIPKKGIESPDWYVYYALRDPETGEMVPQKKRMGINRFKTNKERKREGNILKDEINKLLRSGHLTLGKKKESMALIDLLEKIYTNQIKGLEKETGATYKHVKNKFIGYLKKNSPASEVLMPSEFSSSDAMEYSFFLSSDCGLAGISHNMHINGMKMFFNIMVDPMEVVKKNPFIKIPKKPVVKNNNIVFTPEDREKIKKYCIEKNKPLLLLFTGYIYSCGLRVKETALLQRSQIDLDRWVILVRAGRAKNDDQLPITIPPAFREQVRKHCEGVPQDYYMFSKKFKPGPTPLDYKNAGRVHLKMLRALKIDGKGYKFYGYKHTGVEAFMRAAEKNGKRGDALIQLMTHLRHTDPKTTMIYLRSLGFNMGEDFANLQPEF